MAIPSTYLDRYIEFLLRRHVAVVVAAAALTVLLAAGIGRLTVTNDMHAYFSADNPQLVAFNALENVFDRQDNVSFIVVADGAGLFSPARLRLLHALTELGWQVPYSRRVVSIANHQHTWSRGDDLFVERLIDEPVRIDAARAERIRDIALAEPALVGRLVSADARMATVDVRLTLPEGNLKANDEVVDWVRPRLAEMAAVVPGVEIHVGGFTASNVALGEAVQRDISTLVGLSYLVIVVGLVVLLRHVAGTVATLLVITFSILGTMGIFGWFGATLEAVSGFVPSVVMTMGVADSVHILASFYHSLKSGRSRDDAVRESMRINAAPVLITSVTTAIGVLALNFSDSPPYRELGNMVAVGVLLAFAFSMTLLPALLAWMPAGGPVKGARFHDAMTALAGLVIRRRRALLGGVGLLVVVLTAMIPRNELTERWNDYFDDTFEIRRAADAVATHYGWMHTVRYNLESGREQGVNDPAYLAGVEAFASWLRARPEVAHVQSITDLVARLNMNLHGDDPDERRLPESAELTAQFLLLYEMSLPLGQGLDDSIDVRRGASQLVAFVARGDSERLIALDREARDWLAANVPAVTTTEGTSVDMMFAHINHRNIRELLKGMLIAVLGIAVLLVVALRSVRLGLLSLLTNLAPIGLAYGTWALLVGTIDLSASVVMCMSLGVVVDDTVHFLSKYRWAKSEWGHDTAGALRYAFETVGVALCITTTVLVAGFGVLAASHFDPTVTTGALMALTLAYALVVDFLFLPPLLLELERHR